MSNKTYLLAANSLLHNGRYDGQYIFGKVYSLKTIDLCQCGAIGFDVGFKTQSPVLQCHICKCIMPSNNVWFCNPDIFTKYVKPKAKQDPVTIHIGIVDYGRPDNAWCNEFMEYVKAATEAELKKQGHTPPPYWRR